MQANGSENIAKAYAKAAKELRRHPLRVYNKDRLLEVSGFGPATSNVALFTADRMSSTFRLAYRKFCST